MSLNKKKMVREIGRRTRLKNRDVQAVIETLIDVWAEELVAGGRIEIEGFLTIRTAQTLALLTTQNDAVPSCKRVVTHVGKVLRHKLNGDEAV